MDTTTDKQQGTSLQILAPYLPYGIEVENTFLLPGTRKRLRAEELQSDSLFFEQMYSWPFADCLPVLRPFSALCDPLPGSGEVPAEIIAEMTGNRIHQGEAIQLSKDGKSLIFVHKEYGNTHFINEDFLSDPGMTLKIAEYLTRNHFVRPVNGKPLVEGVDYIPLKP